MSKIAVMIPCYNEALTIRDVVRDWRSRLPFADIYVYDNNSTDGTAEKAAEEGAIVRKESQQGKGNVVRSMFQDIEADCYIIVDGDDTYPADEADRLVEMVLKDGYDMVIGDRLSSTYFAENKRQFHGFGNILVKDLINKLYGTDIHDAMSGLRAMSPRFVKGFKCDANGFEVEVNMDIYAAVTSMRIGNLPTPYRDRPRGSESKLNTIQDGIKIIFFILKHRFFNKEKPLVSHPK